MLEFAPAQGAVPPSSVDRDVAGLGRAFVNAILDGDFARLQALTRRKFVRTKSSMRFWTSAAGAPNNSNWTRCYSVSTSEPVNY